MNKQFGNPMMIGGISTNNNMNNMNMMGMGNIPINNNMNMMGMGNMPINNNMNMMGMCNMPMNNNMNMMGNGGMQMNEDEEWLKGFNMGYEEVNNPGNSDPDLDAPGPKITVHFSTTLGGTSRNIIVNINTTIQKTLKKYLKSIGKEELEGSDKISFLFNASKLAFDDQTTAGNFFGKNMYPKIIVIDTNNLIGA